MYVVRTALPLQLRLRERALMLRLCTLPGFLSIQYSYIIFLSIQYIIFFIEFRSVNLEDWAQPLRHTLQNNSCIEENALF
jgi:hypothetical protein